VAVFNGAHQLVFPSFAAGLDGGKVVFEQGFEKFWQFLSAVFFVFAEQVCRFFLDELKVCFV
jgi:hypothetical protein